MQAHAPEHVVPGGLPTEALIAEVIVANIPPAEAEARYDAMLEEHAMAA